MLLETTTTTKKMVEVSFPLYAKDEEYNRLYYVNKFKDILSIQVWPVSGLMTIEQKPLLPTVVEGSELENHKEQIAKIAGLPNIRPSEFWKAFDKALQVLQETVYIDRGNLFK